MHGKIKAVMEKLNFYRLAEGSLAAGEISAYEAAIEFLDSELAELSRELFPDTAEGYGLSLWEEALGIRGEEGTVLRRNKIIRKENQSPGSFEGHAFLRELGEICPGSSLTHSGEKVVVTGVNRNDIEVLRELATLILPNLSPIAEPVLEGTGLNWDTWESRLKNWNYYDRSAIPWSFYDTI